jgi:hypothetical protein
MSTARTPATLLRRELQHGIILQVRLFDRVFEIEQMVVVAQLPNFARRRNDMEVVERSRHDMLEMLVFVEFVRIVARQRVHDQTHMMLVVMMAVLFVMLVFRFFTHESLQENIATVAMTIVCSPRGRTDLKNANGGSQNVNAAHQAKS